MCRCSRRSGDAGPRDRPPPRARTRVPAGSRSCAVRSRARASSAREPGRMTSEDSVRARWDALRHDLLALLWPGSCVACGAPDRVCCAPCLAEIRGQAGAAPRPLVRRLPRPERPALELRAAGRYDGALRAGLVAYKHAGRVGLAKPLGARLGPVLGAAIATAPEPPLVVAVPSRPARVRERGIRHLEPVVRAALRGRPPRRGAGLALRALRTTRGRRSQVGLDRAARRGNAARIAVRRSHAGRIRGRAVVLVDDVCTSGATLSAAADALERAGARAVSAVSICVVEENAEPGGSGACGSGRVRERRNGAPGRRPPA